MIWRDEAGPPEACAQVRSLMARQVFRHRLAAGFGDDVRVAAKTGTLPGLHNEVGVAEYRDGRRYAVAVFARTPDRAANRTGTDVAIGTAARTAVDFLRDGPFTPPRPGVMPGRVWSRHGSGLGRTAVRADLPRS